MKRLLMALVGCLSLLGRDNLLRADDWPMWRCNTGRTAATAERLPTELHLQWSWQFPPLQPAWPEDPRLQFDASYEPIVVGKMMFLASSRNDSVTAIDTETGARRWRFFADGPIRFAPLAHKGRVYFGADDGCFYCLDAASGGLLWKRRAAPTVRHALGNGRLTSVWPVRGGPVLIDDQVHFTAGVWPFEGVVLHTVDAENGEVVQTRTLDGEAPQGYLVGSGNNLFFPCGRDNVYGLNRKTRTPVRVSYQAKGLTDYHVMASGSWLFHGGKVVNVKENRTLPANIHRPVVSDGQVFYAQNGEVLAIDLNKEREVETRDRKGKIVKVLVPEGMWRFPGASVTQIDVKAGNRLYAHREGTVLAIDIPAAGGDPKVSWQANIKGTVSSMLVADGRLFVVTLQGGLHCFGPTKTEPMVYGEKKAPLSPASPKLADTVDQMLEQAGTKDGYCIVMGINSDGLLEELLRQSQFQVIVVDSDEQKVNQLRRRMDDKGLYGTRLVALKADPRTFDFPPYLANLVVSEGVIIKDTATASHVFDALRPYGGVACLMSPADMLAALAQTIKDASLPEAQVERVGELSVVRRVGALPGAADWTHEYGDPANTLMSRDKLVKAPLGVLWFGGASSSGDMFYDRHDWGPSLAVIEGRMFIQGPKKLTAVDVYTGRILWQIPIPDGISPGRRANWSPSGFHFVAVKDGVYLAFSDKCVKLDPKSGEQLAEFTLPEKGDKWGRIRIVDELMIVPVFHRSENHGSVPSRLLAMDRHSGEVKWTKAALSSFPMVAVGGGKVFCYEGMLEGLYVGASRDRKGGAPVGDEFLSVKAFDLATGEEEWSRSTLRPASWLAYSEEHDVLLVSNKHGIDALEGTSGDELWTKTAEGNGFRGHPENYWDKVIVWKDQIIDQRGPGNAYDLKTGEPVMRKHPITGADVSWQFTKTGHHCNYAIANEHLMTFRAASAGFCDLSTGGTARLEGFRSGCRNSLIPANGVLNAPNFAHGCVCSYPIFTSLALVNVPESNLWTYSAYSAGAGPVERVGINFGASGDRIAEDGTPWLNYPNVGDKSLDLVPKVTAQDAEWFELNSTDVEGDLGWVAGSGLKGVKTVSIPLATGNSPAVERSFTVRLYFAEPDQVAKGDRVFDVLVQGNPVIEDFDIIGRAGGPRKMVVKQLKGIKADAELSFAFAPQHGEPLICGIEVVAERQ